MRELFHSIRWQVQVWHGLILLVSLAVFCVTAYQFAAYYQMGRVDKNLMMQERVLIRSLMKAVHDGSAGKQETSTEERLAGGGEVLAYLKTNRITLPPETTRIFGSRDAGGLYFSIRDREGNVLLESEHVPAGLEPLPIPEKLDMAEENVVIGTRREFRRSIPQGLRTVIGQDITPERDELRRFAKLLAVAGLGVWLVGSLGGWWLTGRAISPIKTISRTAERIAQGNLEERIPVPPGRSELGQLSQVLNQTFSRLHDSFQRQQQFTADASHELRTPVTIQLAETQRILKRDRSPEEYREAIQVCASTAQQMRELIESLLILARGETNQPMEADECDLAAIVREAILRLTPLADVNQILIHQDLQPCFCRGDAASLVILVSNLLGNAIHHNNPGGRVHLLTSHHGGGVRLEVRDNGPGIPDADLPHIFERFYRADQARTSSAGHTGLGLSIAKAIAENHRGNLTATTLKDGGACFQLDIPAAAHSTPDRTAKA